MNDKLNSFILEQMNSLFCKEMTYWYTNSRCSGQRTTYQKENRLEAIRFQTFHALLTFVQLTKIVKVEIPTIF